jgi:hypothetical protein
MGGIPELSTSADFAIDETGEVERSPFGTWQVMTDDGERLVLPVSETAVVWLDKPVEQRVPEGKKRLDEAMAKIAAGKTRPPVKVYRCPTPSCASTYTKEIEARICARRDAPRVGNEPVFSVVGDCKLCGYPVGLHTYVQPEDACILEYEAVDGSGERRRHREPHRPVNTGT